jgi:hypothetical protein
LTSNDPPNPSRAVPLTVGVVGGDTCEAELPQICLARLRRMLLCDTMKSRHSEAARGRTQPQHGDLDIVTGVSYHDRAG